MVEEILKLTFPMFLDQSAVNGQLGKMLERGNLEVKENNSQRNQLDNFWTLAIVRQFIRMQGQRNGQMEYDNYYKLGQSEEEGLRERINEKYAKIRALYSQGRINQIDLIKCEILEDQRRLSQIRSKTSEYVFNSRNSEKSVSWMIDLHGLTKVEALRVTRARLSMT